MNIGDVDYPRWGVRAIPWQHSTSGQARPHQGLAWPLQCEASFRIPPPAEAGGSLELTSMERKRVVVVGAGFAGLTVAKRMADAGHEVILLEKRSIFGGKCSSWQD